MTPEVWKVQVQSSVIALTTCMSCVGIIPPLLTKGDSSKFCPCRMRQQLLRAQFVSDAPWVPSVSHSHTKLQLAGRHNTKPNRKHDHTILPEENFIFSAKKKPANCVPECFEFNKAFYF